MPDRVVYPARPVALDRDKDSSTAAVLDKHALLMEMFQGLAKLGPCQKPKNVCAGQVFVAIQCEPTCPLARPTYRFFHMNGAVDNSGIERAEQIFHEYTPVETLSDQLVGLTIKAKLNPPR